jgi:ribosomal protein S4
MFSNKIYRKYGDIWGELFRMPRRFLRRKRPADVYGRRQKNNDAFYRFTFYVGRFGFTRRRKTRYGRAFVDKQKLKLFYGSIREAYVRRYWSQSLSSQGPALFAFCHLLESRLDSIVMRSNYGFNGNQCKRIIESGLVRIDGFPVLRPSYQIKAFSFVSFYGGRRMAKFYRRLLRRRYRLFPIPSHLLIDYSNFTLLYRGVDAKPFFPISLQVGRLNHIYHV